MKVARQHVQGLKTGAPKTAKTRRNDRDGARNLPFLDVEFQVSGKV
jgi:hypothetical protein